MRAYIILTVKSKKLGFVKPLNNAVKVKVTLGKDKYHFYQFIPPHSFDYLYKISIK